MRRPVPDRALRRVIVELAALDAADRDAILAELDPAQRDKVEALLAENAGIALPAPPPHDDDGDAFAGLSPAFAERVRTGAGMTPDALAALRTCAAEILPRHAAPAAIGRVRPSLLDRIAATLSGRNLRA